MSMEPLDVMTFFVHILHVRISYSSSKKLASYAHTSMRLEIAFIRHEDEEKFLCDKYEIPNE